MNHTSADPLLHDLLERAPHLYALIDPERLEQRPAAPVDFESASAGGRGEDYRQAQRDVLVRRTGIQALLALTAPGGDPGAWRGDHVLLDVLGGDGLLARAADILLPPAHRPTVLTSDLSPGMVAAAQRYGLPALQQAAQNLRLRDGAVDAVLIAYGSHHIPRDSRLVAVAEAHRVLRPSGRLVLHDFADDSPVARWFSDVVHPFSDTGHAYPHYDADDMRAMFDKAGFATTTVAQIYDPMAFVAPTREAARSTLGHHLEYMYGLTRLRERFGATSSSQVATLAEEYFRYPPGRAWPVGTVEAVTYEEVAQGWRVELPRVALIAVGER